MIFCLQDRYDMSVRRTVCRVPIIDHHDSFILCAYYLCDVSPCPVLHGLDMELTSAGGFTISVNPIPILMRRPSTTAQIVHDNIIEIILDCCGIVLFLLVSLAWLLQAHLSNVQKGR